LYGGFSAIKTDGSLWKWHWQNIETTASGFVFGSSIQSVKIMDSATSRNLRGDVLKTDGSLWRQGIHPTHPPIQMSPSKILDSVKTLSSGYFSDMAIKTDGSLWAWGSNLYGEFGNGSDKSSEKPVKIMDSVASVTLGFQHAIAIKTDETNKNV
jgi:hypothetical protein